SAWKSAGCPITYYSVKYKQQQESMWTIVSNRIDVQPNAIAFIDGLHPQSWYLLQVAATSEAGTSEAEYSFLTASFRQNGMYKAAVRARTFLLSVAVRHGGVASTYFNIP